MSQENNSYSLYPEKIVIGASVQITIAPLPGQNRVWLQYLSGGSLYIQGASLAAGSTFATSNNFDVTFTTNPFLLPLSGNLVLGSNGATTTCILLRGLSQGFPGATFSL